MVRRRGVRADLGAGFTNGEGGIVTRGDSGRLRVDPVELVRDTVLCSVEVVVVDAVDS
jgi:hypothetical protein